MGRRPLLEKFPHLHSLLKRDPVANAQFNAAINEVNNSLLAGVEPGGKRAIELDISNKSLAELSGKYQHLVDNTRRVRKLLRLLGEVIEPQCNLKPYTQDVEERTVYEIKFNADQIRLALSLHWELIGQETEASITGSKDDVTRAEEDKEND